MTLLDLIKRASRGYAQDNIDVELTQVCRPDGRPFTAVEYAAAPAGDTLAWAIATELGDTFDPAAKDADQLAEAVRVMENYLRDVENVIDALGG